MAPLPETLSYSNKTEESFAILAMFLLESLNLIQNGKLKNPLVSASLVALWLK